MQQMELLYRSKLSFLIIFLSFVLRVQTNDYKISNKLKALVDLHNIAGMFHENWNKRWIWTVFRDAGNHVIQPPSFSVSLVYKPL